MDSHFDNAEKFQAAFSKTLGQTSSKTRAEPLKVAWHSTPLGAMLSVVSRSHLYMLEFTSRKSLDRGFDRLRAAYNCAVVPGRTPITEQIDTELDAYFAGKLRHFKTPITPTGTEFQNSVWEALQGIPYGGQQAYSDLAVTVGNKKAVRAVASSNARNGLALIIPCHRIIAKDGSLGGYAGGVEKKAWLLAHEAAHKSA